MREIKFRAFEDNRFYYSDSQEDAKALGAKLGGSLISAFFNRFYGHETLGQYTGLKDKNGKEIYEGDILSYDYADHFNPYPEHLKKEPCYIVKYDPDNNFHLGGFDVSPTRKLFAHASRFEKTEVVGNIFTRIPELLK